MEISTLNFLAIFVVSGLASFLSSMSGGGSSMVSIPVYLWLGIPFPFAIAGHQFSSLFWVIPASYNYLKGRIIDWKFLGLYTVIGTIGAFIGATLVGSLTEAHIEPFIGGLIFILVVFMIFRKESVGTEALHTRTQTKTVLMYMTSPILGFYESIFGSGNGIFFSTLHTKLRGTDLMHSLGYYYIISFFWIAVACGVLFSHGFFNLPLALATILGGVIGGYAGSKLGRFKGNQFIRYAFIIMGTVLAIKLLFFS
jgi:uncharacterized membrane protein YfcA